MLKCKSGQRWRWCVLHLYLSLDIHYGFYDWRKKRWRAEVCAYASQIFTLDIVSFCTFVSQMCLFSHLLSPSFSLSASATLVKNVKAVALTYFIGKVAVCWRFFSASLQRMNEWKKKKKLSVYLMSLKLITRSKTKAGTIRMSDSFLLQHFQSSNAFCVDLKQTIIVLDIFSCYVINNWPNWGSITCSPHMTMMKTRLKTINHIELFGSNSFQITTSFIGIVL